MGGKKGEPKAEDAQGSEVQIVIGDHVYGQAEIIAAIRCAETVFSAYATTSEKLCGGSKSLSWSELDAAHDFSTDALPDEQRRSIEAQALTGNLGHVAEGELDIVIETDEELQVTGASIPDDQLQLLLAEWPVLRVRNQEGVSLALYFDMDQETLIAEVPQD